MITFKEDIGITKTDEEFILKHLPPDWDTLIKEVNPSNDMEVIFYINAATIHETNVWFSQFQLLNTTYFIHSSKKSIGEKLSFRKLYKCLHNTKTKEVYDPFIKKHIENVKCPSYLMIKMLAVKRSRKKKSDIERERPCEIKVKLLHNHSLTHGMKIRVIPEIKDKLMQLYKVGYTPGPALAKIKTHIRTNYKGDTTCPDYRYCAYLFDRYRMKRHDHTILKEEYMEKKLAHYNKKMGEECAKMYVDETGLVVCYCTPFVKRVHKYESCSFVYIYTLHYENYKIYTLFTNSEIGTLPLGVIICTSNSPEILEIAFSLHKNMLGDCAFGGKGSTSLCPTFFIVDETLCDLNILTKLWPQSKVLIGTCFILQNVWLWLTKHITENKLDMFTDFYYMMYSSTEVEFCMKYSENKSKYYHHKRYLKFLNGYYEKRKKWVMCFRSKLLSKENYNDTYTESVFQVLKTSDLLKLHRLKLFQAVDFIQNEFFVYFENRIMEAVTIGSVKSVLDLKEDINSIEKIPMTQIKILGNDIHLIPDEQNSYNIVNTNSLTCTCSNKTEVICNHIQWICLLVSSNVFSKKTINISEIKYKYSALIENINRDNFFETKHTTTEATLSCNGRKSTDVATCQNSIREDELNKLFETTVEILNSKLEKQNTDREEIVSICNNESNVTVKHTDDTDEIINIFKNKKISDTSTIVEIQENESNESNNNNKVECDNQVTVVCINNKDKIIEEGKEIWKEVTKIYENFLENSPEEIVSATKVMKTNLNTIQTAPEFCTACENFSTQKTTPAMSDKEVSGSKVSLHSKKSNNEIVDIKVSIYSTGGKLSSCRSLKSNRSVKNT